MMIATHTTATTGTLVEATYDLPFHTTHATLWATLMASDAIEQHAQVDGAACLRVRVAASTYHVVIQALDDTYTVVRVHPMLMGELLPTATPATIVETAHTLLDTCERALIATHHARLFVARSQSTHPQFQQTAHGILLWCRHFLTVQTDPDELALIDQMLDDLDTQSWNEWCTTWNVFDPPLRAQALGATIAGGARRS